jgi:hypothetical protein
LWDLHLQALCAGSVVKLVVDAAVTRCYALVAMLSISLENYSGNNTKHNDLVLMIAYHILIYFYYNENKLGHSQDRHAVYRASDHLPFVAAPSVYTDRFLLERCIVCDHLVPDSSLTIFD